MGKEQQKPNEALRHQRLLRGWSQQKLAELIGAGSEMISYWEGGKKKTSPFYQEKLCELFGLNAEELGFLSESQTMKEERNSWTDTSPKWSSPLKLEQDTESDEDMNPNRRKALQEISALAGAVLVKPKDLLMPLPWADFSKALQERAHFDGSNASDMDNATLGLFKNLTETCWHLAKGNELEVVEHILKSYLPKIEALAKGPVSAKQREAAAIASQGYQLESMLAGHQLNFPVREAYGQLAVLYGNDSKEDNLFVSALTKLGTTFYYKKQSRRSLQVYQEAFRSIHKVSPLLRSRLYVQLATILAQSGREEEAKNSLSLAYENFPAQPQDDPSFLYADYGRPSLSLWAGLTWLELDNPKAAWEIFAQVGGLQPELVISERNRIEIINHQAETAVALGDQELFKTYLQEGLKGAKRLKSEKRRREAWDIYEQAKRTWRYDKGITLLRKDLLDIDNALPLV